MEISKILIAGGAIDEHILVRKAFSAFNSGVHPYVMKEAQHNPDIIHLLSSFTNSIEIIGPITYVTSDENDEQG